MLYLSFLMVKLQKFYSVIGTDAISVDMEVFSKNVVEVVEHLNNQVLQILDETKTQIEVR